MIQKPIINVSRNVCKVTKMAGFLVVMPCNQTRRNLPTFQMLTASIRGMMKTVSTSETSVNF
jgi:hypothetical protein